MPLIANFTTRGFHENCLINEKSASVCREIVFLKTSRFVLSLCGYLTFGGGTVKKLYIQVSDFQVWRDFRFQTGGRNKRHHKGLLAFLNKLGIPFLSLYLIPLCKAF